MLAVNYRRLKKGVHMNQWIDVTNTFSESQRHYKNTYLEICEVTHVKKETR